MRFKPCLIDQGVKVNDRSVKVVILKQNKKNMDIDMTHNKRQYTD